jgi:hypothetical protein
VLAGADGIGAKSAAALDASRAGTRVLPRPGAHSGSTAEARPPSPARRAAIGGRRAGGTWPPLPEAWPGGPWRCPGEGGAPAELPAQGGMRATPVRRHTQALALCGGAVAAACRAGACVGAWSDGTPRGGRVEKAAATARWLRRGLASWWRRRQGKPRRARDSGCAVPRGSAAAFAAAPR